MLPDSMRMMLGLLALAFCATRSLQADSEADAERAVLQTLEAHWSTPANHDLWLPWNLWLQHEPAQLLLTIRPDGSLSELRVLVSSGYPMEDEAAIRAVCESLPLLHFPHNGSTGAAPATDRHSDAPDITGLLLYFDLLQGGYLRPADWLDSHQVSNFQREPYRSVRCPAAEKPSTPEAQWRERTFPTEAAPPVVLPSGYELPRLISPHAVGEPAPFDPLAATLDNRDAGGVTQPVLLHKIEPNWSRAGYDACVGALANASVAAAASGAAETRSLPMTVRLRFTITKKGTTEDFEVLSTPGYGLETQAIEGVKQWRFEPALKNGIPIAVQATAEVNFRCGGAPGVR